MMTHCDLTNDAIDPEREFPNSWFVTGSKPEWLANVKLTWDIPGVYLGINNLLDWFLFQDKNHMLYSSVTSSVTSSPRWSVTSVTIISSSYQRHHLVDDATDNIRERDVHEEWKKWRHYCSQLKNDITAKAENSAGSHFFFPLMIEHCPAAAADAWQVFQLSRHKDL